VSEVAIRAAIVAAAKRLDAAGFMPSKSGNISVRDGDGFVVTPAALPYALLTEADLVRVTPDGSAAPGQRRPSSEWRLHQAIYAARPDAQAIVHTHSPKATALSCARRGLPPFHYMILSAGGPDIRCANHATFGTSALAENCLQGLQGRRAVLLANHGAVAIGATLEKAETLAREVENLAGQYLALLAAGLDPVLLTSHELDEAADQFRDYGR